jgi:hypothetical protein
MKQTPPASRARNQQTGSAATLELAANRNPSLPAQPGAVATQEKRKTAAHKPKKS